MNIICIKLTDSRKTYDNAVHEGVRISRKTSPRLQRARKIDVSIPAETLISVMRHHCCQLGDVIHLLRWKARPYEQSFSFSRAENLARIFLEKTRYFFSAKNWHSPLNRSIHSLRYYRQRLFVRTIGGTYALELKVHFINVIFHTEEYANCHRRMPLRRFVTNRSQISLNVRSDKCALNFINLVKWAETWLPLAGEMKFLFVILSPTFALLNDHDRSNSAVATCQIFTTRLWRLIKANTFVVWPEMRQKISYR